MDVEVNDHIVKAMEDGTYDANVNYHQTGQHYDLDGNEIEPPPHPKVIYATKDVANEFRRKLDIPALSSLPIGPTIMLSKTGDNRRMLQMIGLGYESVSGGYYRVQVPVSDQQLSRTDVLARWQVYYQVNRIKQRRR